MAEESLLLVVSGKYRFLSYLKEKVKKERMTKLTPLKILPFTIRPWSRASSVVHDRVSASTSSDRESSIRTLGHVVRKSLTHIKSDVYIGVDDRREIIAIAFIIALIYIYYQLSRRAIWIDHTRGLWKFRRFLDFLRFIKSI